MENKDVLVLDTSAILNQPNIFHLLKDKVFIIPGEVLEELDNAKTKNDGTGFAARRANNIIEDIRSSGDIIAGVNFDGNNQLIVDLQSSLSLVPEFFPTNFDSRIISIAKKYNCVNQKVSLVSSDVSMRIKAASIGISAIDEDQVLFGNEDPVYSGIKVITVDPDTITTFYNEGRVELFGYNLYPNQAIVMKSSESGSAIGLYKDGFIVKLKTDRKEFSVSGIVPKNKEQKFAIDFLMDPAIPLVSISGLAGSGKTMLAIAAALQMIDKGHYDKLVISRPVVSMSTNMGFLPGDKKEKMQPWVQPIFDNMKFLLKGGDINLMIENGKIEIESLSYIRGRTFPNTIFVLDECQNATVAEMKAVLTRMGHNSKIILTGDIEQIDSPKLDVHNSGLSTVINKFKESHLAAHITLLKSERSELAALSAKVL